MLNYLVVPEGASPVEVSRLEAMDGVLTRFLAQPTQDVSGRDLVALVALLDGGRLQSVWGLSCDVGPGGRVGGVESFRVSRREMRYPVGQLCAAFEGARGVPRVVVLAIGSGVAGGVVLELGYDEADQARWDVGARGVEAVAASVAVVATGGVDGPVGPTAPADGGVAAGFAGEPGGSVVDDRALVGSDGGVLGAGVDLSGGPVSLRVDPDDVVVRPVREAFAVDAAAGWPAGWAAVALMVFADPVDSVVHVVGYSPSGEVVLGDAAWVGASTRAALLGLAGRVVPAAPGPRALLATYLPERGEWSMSVEASSGMGRFAVGSAEAVLIAQEINPVRS